MSSITKPSRPASSFVAAAPDAKPRQSKQDRRRQITLTIPADMLLRLDAMAAETGQTRAGLLLLGAARLLRDGV